MFFVVVVILLLLRVYVEFIIISKRPPGAQKTEKRKPDITDCRARVGALQGSNLTRQRRGAQAGSSTSLFPGLGVRQDRKVVWRFLSRTWRESGVGTNGLLSAVLCQAAALVLDRTPRLCWISHVKSRAHAAIFGPESAVFAVPGVRSAPMVLIGWPLPLDFGLDGRLLLARRGRVCV